MNQHLQTIHDFIETATHLSDEEKTALTKAAKDADKALTISEFKLERTEKVKRTTAILLEETIQELEIKRKAVEAQNKELVIEAALERVRAKTMAMQHSDELQDAAYLMFQQIETLGVPAFGCGFNIWDDDRKVSTAWMAGESRIQPSFKTSSSEDIFARIHAAAKKGDSLFVEEQSGKALKAHYKYMLSIPVFKGIVDEMNEKGHSLPPHQIMHCAFFPQGYLMFISFEPVPESHDIFKRFVKVFEQTYTRFLDLQKAEAQNRESQIQLSLERVRAKAMAMHNSDDLATTIRVFYEEFVSLSHTPIIRCGAGVFRQKTAIVDISAISLSPDNELVEGRGTLDMSGHPLLRGVYKNWLQQKEFSTMLKGREITSYYQYLNKEFSVPNYPDDAAQYALFPMFTEGSFYVFTEEPLMDDDLKTFRRFNSVLSLTYRRYNDLLKAEAQTREARINLAVERVRAKALAMHASEEIMEVVAKLKDEIMNLDIPDVVAATILLKEGEDKVRMWDLSTLEKNNDGYEIPFDITFKLKNRDPNLYVKRVWENQENYFLELQEAKDFKRVVAWLRENQKTDVADAAEEFFETTQLKRLHHAVKKLNNGKLVIDLLNPPSDEMETILTKMAAAFDLAYRRFEDLQKAESQAREAQIEASLERVRSKTMAMHSSQDVGNTMVLLFEELEKLGIKANRNGIIRMDDEEHGEIWTAKPNINNEIELIAWNLDMSLHDLTKQVYKAWKNKDSGTVYSLIGDDQKAYYKALNKSTDIPVKFNLENLPEREWGYTFNFNEGFIYLFTDEKMLQEHEQIPERFASVFGQTYRRYQDLLKAEAQTKEARIEAALERVRSRSMAMHKSEELLDVISVVSEQLQQLEFRFVHVSFANNEIGQDYKYWVSAKGQAKPMRFTVPYKNIAMFNRLKEAQEKSLSFFTDILTKEEHNQWHTHLLNHGGTEVFSKEENEFVMSRGMARSISLNPNIMLILANYASIPYSEEDNKIIERFGKVFEQSYTRFLDLQKAEAQAREAQIEIALERVRSRTLAMQNSEELAETSVVVFQQLLELGISPNRLFIGLIDSDGKCIDAWATNEDGTKLANHFMLEASKNNSISKMAQGWKDNKKSIVIDMKGKELQSYFHYLSKELKIPFQQGLKQERRVQTIAYFSGGLIGMAANEEQPEESIELLERFAAVFNLTYTRFKDLKIAEAHAIKAEEDLIQLQTEKKRAEEALTELQSTQKQLIQSEKMASLGELTAGIAHEIQNPLNFVNNFSEVSNELIDEMSEEIEKGDLEEAKFIMADIKSNLEKINHHGKRADAIVKGMLQHSRTSSAEKEPTDINKLADEYLRLAYHGLRAKDKSFNATLETDFDDSIGKISVIPQDIGRVILNLITNAFYAINEKQNAVGNDLSGFQNLTGLDKYEPTVSVSTKKQKNTITISVKDNGNGIPKQVLDKIFQPFFTTKPTGQGTGLGLSMSYDIITKSHGGELTVQTEERMGTTFSIMLPS